MSLYRKYRPQLLSELDSIEVRDRLIKVLSSAYTPHAFLLSGPKGTGKTSAARIIAKVLNCERNKKTGANLSIEPCNKCDSCVSIIEGRHMDIIEIDAASNRGIEEIRDLREKIRLAPVSAAFKVYIIDEVHMLTNEAFNALLKTLEEPPAHAVFILATTEPDKLLPTILSRCIRFNFHKATASEVKNSLKRVVRGEKITVEEIVLDLLSSAADGSFRDGTKLLEQAIAENALKLSDAEKLLGSDGVKPEKYLLLLHKKNITEILVVTHALSEKGTDFRFFVSQILNLLHDILMSQYGIREVLLPKELETAFSPAEILTLIKTFCRVYTEVRNASFPELPLEVAAVEWCESKNTV